jgi:hypothetical protein
MCEEDRGVKWRNTGPAYTHDLSFRDPYEEMMNMADDIIVHDDERMVFSAVSASKTAYSSQYPDGVSAEDIAGFLAATPELVSPVCKLLEKKGAFKGKGRAGISTRRYSLNEKGTDAYIDSEYKRAQKIKDMEPPKLSEIFHEFGKILSKLETSKSI